MTVDAQYLHHLLAAGHLQPAAAAADHGHAARAGAAAAAMGGGGAGPPFSAPRQYGCYGGGEVVAAGGAAVEGQQGYESSYMGVPTSTAAAAGAGVDQYSQFLTLAAVDLAQRGATFGGSGAQEMATNKRKRAEQYMPVLGAAEAAAHAQQQLIVVDRLLLNHAEKMWTGLAEQRRRHMRVIAAAVEAKAAKRLRAKDEEIERMRSLNWALEERLRTVSVEAQVWRDLAQSNEATANVLRGELEQALDAQVAQARCAADGGGGGDDAESCCCAENDVDLDRGEEEEEVRTPVERPRGARRCKGCGEGAAVVLLLPCRHLCACAACAASVPACPECGCAKNGSVCVNFS